MKRNQIKSRTTRERAELRTALAKWCLAERQLTEDVCKPTMSMEEMTRHAADAVKAGRYLAYVLKCEQEDIIDCVDWYEMKIVRETE